MLLSSLQRSPLSHIVNVNVAYIRLKSVHLFPRSHHSLALITPSLSSLPRSHHSLALITPSLSSLPRSHHSLALITPSLSSLPRSHHSLALITPSLSSLPLSHHSLSLITPSLSSLESLLCLNETCYRGNSNQVNIYARCKGLRGKDIREVVAWIAYGKEFFDILC